MYKTILALAILYSAMSCAQTNEHFYAFVMHVTHDNVYDRIAWHDSSRMLQMLGEICQNSDKQERNWQSLTICIDAVIETIQNIFTCCKDKQGINISIRLLREPEDDPEHGLFISLESALEMTSARNAHRIETILTEIDFIEQEDEEEHVLNILKMIRPVLLLSAGNVWIRVINK